MTIIGFNFTKIAAEKRGPVKGKISVSRSCNPTGVEEVKIGSGQAALRYTFLFQTEFKPDVGGITLEGNITELADEKTVKDTVAAWDGKKALPPKRLEKIMNGILNRCHVEALVLSKELNIPPPINLPKVKVKEASAKDAPKK